MFGVNAFETLARLRAKEATPKSLAGAPVPAISSNHASPLVVATQPLRQTFAVTHIQGLHARPCALFISTLQPFRCQVRVQNGKHIVNGRSILGLLSLAAGCHSKLTVTMDGPDSAAAMDAIKRLFETGFSQVYNAENLNPS